MKDEVCISHCFREANRVADKLANIGIDGKSDFAFFSIHPKEVLDLMYADNVGAAWPRLVMN